MYSKTFLVELHDALKSNQVFMRMWSKMATLNSALKSNQVFMRMWSKMATLNSALKSNQVFMRIQTFLVELHDALKSNQVFMYSKTFLVELHDALKSNQVFMRMWSKMATLNSKIKSNQVFMHSRVHPKIPAWAVPVSCALCGRIRRDSLCSSCSFQQQPPRQSSPFLCRGEQCTAPLHSALHSTHTGCHPQAHPGSLNRRRSPTLRGCTAAQSSPCTSRRKRFRLRLKHCCSSGMCHSVRCSCLLVCMLWR